MKIVINKCYGGFGLSTKALKLFYKEKYGIDSYAFKQVGSWNDKIWERVPEEEENERGSFTYLFNTENPTGANEEYCSQYECERTDPILIEIVERLGKESFGPHAKLSIIEIPDDVEWEIKEYDGIEWVAEKHRTWD